MSCSFQSTALLAVDVQVDFVPGGALATPHGDQVVPAILDLITNIPYKLIVFSLDWHPPQHISFLSRHQRALQQQQQPSARSPETIAPGATHPPCTRILLQYTPSGKLCSVHCDEHPEQPILTAIPPTTSDASHGNMTTFSSSRTPEQVPHLTAAPAGPDPHHTLLTVRQRLWPDHCIQGSHGAQLQPQLASLMIADDNDDEEDQGMGSTATQQLLSNARAHQAVAAASHIPVQAGVKQCQYDSTANQGGAWIRHALLQLSTPAPAVEDKASVPRQVLLLYKGADPDLDSYSLFYDNGHIRQSGLHAVLVEHSITTLHVTGLALEVCVGYTCLDALGLGYQVVVVSDATSPVTHEGGEQTLRMIKEAGARVMDVRQLLNEGV